MNDPNAIAVDKITPLNTGLEVNQKDTLRLQKELATKRATRIQCLWSSNW